MGVTAENPVTPGIAGSIGSNGVFDRLICPRCRKPETARTAGRSGRAGEASSPALSPASLSSASHSLENRLKSLAIPRGGVLGRPAVQSRTQPLTAGHTGRFAGSAPGVFVPSAMFSVPPGGASAVDSSGPPPPE